MKINSLVAKLPDNTVFNFDNITITNNTNGDIIINTDTDYSITICHILNDMDNITKLTTLWKGVEEIGDVIIEYK